MSVEHLPWEEVPGPIYSARELKPRKKWVTVGSWILSVVLVVGGILTPYRVLILFGVLYVLTLLMKKDTVVTRRGLEMFYQMRITTQYNFWGWDEIVSVVREDRNHPELVALYFGIGDKAKRLFFTKEDAQHILELARACKPQIVIQDAPKQPPNSSRSVRKKKR